MDQALSLGVIDSTMKLALFSELLVQSSTLKLCNALVNGTWTNEDKDGAHHDEE